MQYVRASILLLAAATVACGKSSPGSPTAPSNTALAAFTNSASTASISGSIIQSGLSGGVATTKSVTASSGTSSGISVSVAGTTLSTNVNGSNQFTLQNVPPGDVHLQFTGPGINAMLGVPAVQPAEAVTMTVSLSGTTATIESDSRGDSTTREIEGRVDALPPATPAGTFSVNGQIVTTDATTRFTLNDAPGSFSDLVLGARVHASGKISGTAFLASLVNIQNTDTTIPVEVNGVVTLFSGTSTSFQFTVGTQVVKGDGTTQFFGGSLFSDLANGVRVEVKGQQRQGFVFATQVHVDTPDTTETGFEGEGSVSGLTGSCPTIHFVLNGTAINTTSSTTFQPGCSAVVAGAKVDIEGTRQADGSVVAASVRVEVETVDVEGTASALSGTCPALHFTVNSVVVATSASTTFQPGCTAVVSGAKVEVKGTKQPDGSISAQSVSVDTEPAEVNGAVSALSGTCPVIQFTVNAVKVSTTASTVFATPCGSLANSSRVSVQGTRQSDGSIVATRVEGED